ncbi:uncharacterized protein CC84DRAFT_1177211 [Paraphaeosphaeria sporulosa]|uniref:Uncharacterized protein n=1 Tax=Paraphaeosphaeria sporulosa TaxID=1460663 RepID=A0A177CDW7_9PLEO|nr:uncharacterized protein CC84DRAFT_1177211 [Paraphaeosphaeria sporulosa]OAG05112.1 hypothetical protein CC84DRAFT_1177211 [Paraphaeosphaeria sporulosa]
MNQGRRVGGVVGWGAVVVVREIVWRGGRGRTGSSGPRRRLQVRKAGSAVQTRGLGAAGQGMGGLGAASDSRRGAVRCGAALADVLEGAWRMLRVEKEARMGDPEDWKRKGGEGCGGRAITLLFRARTPKAAHGLGFVPALARCGLLGPRWAEADRRASRALARGRGRRRRLWRGAARERGRPDGSQGRTQAQTPTQHDEQPRAAKRAPARGACVQRRTVPLCCAAAAALCFGRRRAGVRDWAGMGSAAAQLQQLEWRFVRAERAKLSGKTLLMRESPPPLATCTREACTIRLASLRQTAHRPPHASAHRSNPGLPPPTSPSTCWIHPPPRLPAGSPATTRRRCAPCALPRCCSTPHPFAQRCAHRPGPTPAGRSHAAALLPCCRPPSFCPTSQPAVRVVAWCRRPACSVHSARLGAVSARPFAHAHPDPQDEDARRPPGPPGLRGQPAASRSLGGG